MEDFKKHPRFSLLQIESYLLSKGWQRDAEIRNVASVWHRQGAEDEEVVLPMFPSVKDYAQRLNGAIKLLASFEKRSIDELSAEVERILFSSITVRVIASDTDGGTIPINDGVLLISKAKELLYSAAMSIHVKKRHYTGAPPKDVRAYVDSLLLGQTEVGSYIVNVLAPAQGASSSTGTDSDKSYSEAVTVNLVESLSALAVATGAYQDVKDPKVFDSSIFNGASANMCDALVGFSGSAHNREFEIKVAAAAKSMLPRDIKIFSFDIASVRALQRASDYLKDDFVMPDREVLGFVKRLLRPKDDEAGTITIDALVGDTERGVQVVLSAEDYHKAILAHDDKMPVKCRGDIHVKGRTATLLNPRDFEIVGMESMF